MSSRITMIATRLISALLLLIQAKEHSLREAAKESREASEFNFAMAKRIVDVIMERQAEGKIENEDDLVKYLSIANKQYGLKLTSEDMRLLGVEATR